MDIQSTSREAWLKIAKTRPEAIKPIFECEQSTEILARTSKIMNRIFPKLRVPHGFYDPAGFFEALEISAKRREIQKMVQTRITEKVKARDKGITLEEMTGRIIAPIHMRGRQNKANLS